MVAGEASKGFGTGQVGFAVGPDNSFQVNLLDNLFSRFGNSVDVSKLALSRRIWNEVPAGNTVVLDLLDPNSRQVHFLDEHRNIFGTKPFERKDKIEKLSLALVMIEPLTPLSQSVIAADIEAIVNKLSPKGGGLIVVEKIDGEGKPDQSERVALLANISSRLIKPNFLTAYKGVCLWETRKKLPNLTWQAIKKRNQERTNKQEGVGTHVSENLNAGLDIINIGAETISNSRVGEEDGIGPIIDFKSSVVIPAIKTNAERRLSFGLADQKKKADERDARKFFISPEMLDSSMGFAIKRTCPSGAHAGQPQLLTTTLRKLEDNPNGTIRVLVDTACGHCDYHEPERTVDFKSYEKRVGDKKLKGWVSVN